jgi:hypothetical protein
MIKRTINIPVYNCKVVVYFDHDINDLARKLCKKHKVEREDGEAYAEVFGIAEHIHLYFILFSVPSLTMNLFVHEITHLGGRILKDRGHHNPDHDEPLAYLNGYLAGEIEKIMQKNQIEFKKPKTNGKNNKVHGEEIPGSPS